MNCGSSAKLNRKNIWSFSLKFKSRRVSNDRRSSLMFGELVKLVNKEEFVGFGYKFISATAFRSNRPAGIMFKLQAASVKLVVLAEHVLPGPMNGSRTYPLAVRRVVAGSRMVPVGMVRPSTSVSFPVCPVIRS